MIINHQLNLLDSPLIQLESNLLIRHDLLIVTIFLESQVNLLGLFFGPYFRNSLLELTEIVACFLKHCIQMSYLKLCKDVFALDLVRFSVAAAGTALQNEVNRTAEAATNIKECVQEDQDHPADEEKNGEGQVNGAL